VLCSSGNRKRKVIKLRQDHEKAAAAGDEAATDGYEDLIGGLDFS
jgi:hypothetical protein